MKKFICILLVNICCVIFVACGNGNDHTGEAKTPSGSSIMKGKDYKSVVEEFEKKGFTNVKLEKIEDLITGWLTKDGEVEEVSVGGDFEYSSDKWVNADIDVIIRYHTFPEKEIEVTEQKSEENTKQEEVNEPEIYTVDNCPDMVEFVKNSDPEFLKEFAKKYMGKTIQFNGAVDIFEKHPKYNTRYEALLRTCDFNPDTIQGPAVKTIDFNFNDDRKLSDLSEGNNVIITAKVFDYNEDNGLFRVTLEKIESR